MVQTSFFILINWLLVPYRHLRRRLFYLNENQFVRSAALQTVVALKALGVGKDVAVFIGKMVYEGRGRDLFVTLC